MAVVLLVALFSAPNALASSQYEWEWDLMYPSSVNGEFLTGCMADDSNYILAGFRCNNSSGATYSIAQDAYIVKSYPNGTLVWETTISASTADKMVDVCVLSDGTIIAVGSRGMVWKVADNGTLLNTTSLYSTANDFTAVLPDAEDNVILVGNRRTVVDGYIAKLYTGNMTMAWAVYPGGSGNDYLYSGFVDSDGNIIAAGQSASYGSGYNYWWCNYYPNGTEIYNTTWGVVEKSEGLYTCVQTDATTYLFSGYNGSYSQILSYDKATGMLNHVYNHSAVNINQRGLVNCTNGNITAVCYGWYSIYMLNLYPNGTLKGVGTSTSFGIGNVQYIYPYSFEDASGNMVAVGFDRYETNTDRPVIVIHDNDSRYVAKYDYVCESSGNFNDVAIDGDGNYIYAGRTYINACFYSYAVKTYPNGTEIWNRTYNFQSTDYLTQFDSVMVTCDGNYLFTGRQYYNYSGRNRQATAVLVAPDGTLLWVCSLGDNWYEYGYDSVENETFYIIVGHTTDTALNIGGGGYVSLLHKNGTFATHKGFGGPGIEYFYDIENDMDGNFYCAGFTASYGAGGNDAWLVKLDSSFNELWNVTFGSATYNDYFNDITLAADGNILTCGHYNNVLCCFNKYYPNGTLIWNVSCTGPLSSSATALYEVVEREDGNLIAAGYGGAIGFGSQAFILETYANGTIIQKWTYGQIGNEYAYGMAMDTDEYLVLAGSSTSYCTAYGPWAYKWHSDGSTSLLWVNNTTSTGSVANVTVYRTRSTYGSVSVNYTTEDDTAVAGVDYVATSGTLTFADGQVSMNISVPLLSGSGKRFKVIISDPSTLTIRTYAHLGRNMITDGLSLAYDMSLLNATTVADITGNNRYGTISGGEVSYPEATGAYYLYGNGNDYITIPTLNDPRVNGINYTIYSIVRFEDLSRNNGIFGDDYGRSELWRNDSKIEAQIVTVSNAARYEPCASIYDNNTAGYDIAYLISHTDSNFDVDVYLNTTKTISATYEGTNSIWKSHTIMLAKPYIDGARVFTYLYGNMYFYALYNNTTLTPADIQQNYEANYWRWNTEPNASWTSTAYVDIEGVSTPIVQFNLSSYTVNEGAGTVTLNISKIGTASCYVNYSTMNGTALAGVNYIEKSGLLVFDENEMNEMFTIDITNTAGYGGDTTFFVNLTATNATFGGNRNVSIIIAEDDAPATFPVAYFTANTTSGVAPLAVQFWDNTTGYPTSWQWSFGDGTANSTSQNPVHTYTTAGTYTVILTATNAGGSDTLSRDDYIRLSDQLPIANFSGSITVGGAPLDVAFADASTGSPTSWQWNFGDNTANETSQNPSHTYTVPGKYNVTLTVSNACGSNATKKTNYINVTGYSWTLPYNYRKQINVTGSVDGAQTNYQIPIMVFNTTGFSKIVNNITVIYTGGRSQNWPYDINFTDVEDECLPYWMEEGTNNSTYAQYWVLVPNIPASPSNTTIKIYYGNSNDGGSSNISTVYDRYDTFNGGGFNSTRYLYTGTVPVVSDGHMNITQNSATITDVYANNTLYGFGPGYALQTRAWYVNETKLCYVGQVGYAGTNGYVLWVLSNIIGYCSDIRKAGGSSYGGYSPGKRPGWNVWETAININKTVAYVALNNSKWASYTTQVSQATGFSWEVSYGGTVSTGWSVNMSVDWWIARKWTQNEPKAGIAQSEIANGSAPSETSLVGFNATSFTVAENAGNVYINATRTYNLDTVCYVNYTTTNGTALAGQNYTATSGRLVFDAGEENKTINIPIIDNAWYLAQNKTFYVNLTSTNASFGLYRNVSVTIGEDDEAAATLQYNASSHTTWENATSIVLNITKTGTGACVVNYTTANYTALAGVDYVATSGQFNFADEDTSKTFTVNLFDDQNGNGPVLFYVNLTSTDVAMFGASRNVTVKIGDDEMPNPRLNNTFVKKNSYIADLGCDSNAGGGAGYTPAEIMAAYRDLGFDAAAITDTLWWYIPYDPLVPGITYLTGFEWNGGLPSNPPIPYEHGDVSLISASFYGGMPYAYNQSHNYYHYWEDVRNFSKRHNALVFYTHPVSSNNWDIARIRSTAQDYDIMSAISAGMEQQLTTRYDPWISEGNKLWLAEQSDNPGGLPDDYMAYCVIQADNSNNATLIDALKQGNMVVYKGSYGCPYNLHDFVQNISVSGMNITMTLEAAADVMWIGNNGTVYKIQNGTSVATYNVTGSEKYIRAYVSVDTNDFRAWTQPIFIENDGPIVKFNTSTKPQYSYLIRESVGNLSVDVVKMGTGACYVNYSAYDGTAIAGQNYIATSGQLFFSAGEMSKTITVPLVNDSIRGWGSIFYINITSTNATYGNVRNATVSLVDDDLMPLQFNVSGYSVNESDGSVTVNVTKTGYGRSSVNYSTYDGTAIAGLNYTATSGTLSFNETESYKTITIQIADDDVVDGDQTFYVNLTALGAPTIHTLQNSTFGTNRNVSVLIIEDDVTVPAPNFTANVTYGVAPLAVQFWDNSTGYPESWQWDFDNDGVNDSSEHSPAHVYESPGTYSVRLYAINMNGTAYVTKAGYITVIANMYPSADFHANATSGLVPLCVQFTDDSIGYPSAWQWDFGDETSNSTGQNPAHVYYAPGTYTVTLTVSNANGTDAEQKIEYIRVVAPTVPTPEFSVNITSGVEPLCVAFSDLTTGYPSSWTWDFDNDGMNDSGEQSPVYIYASAGTYSVRMYASNTNGTAITMKESYITVVARTYPCANFSANVTEGLTPLWVQFWDNSTDASLWEWNFGDGTANSTLQNPAHMYDADGTYTVTLTASNANGSDVFQRAEYVVVTVSSSVGFVTDDLFSYYNWTGDSGSTIVDNSGNGHNGTNSGSVLINGPVAKRTFDGSATISLPQQPVAGWEGFAYETIILPTNVTPGTKHGIKGQSYGYNALYLDGAKLVIRIVNAGGYAVEARSANISTDKPIHVVMTYNNTTKYARLYINGVYVTKVPLSIYGGYGQVWNTFLGTSLADSYIVGMGKFEGSMRYFRIYDTNLSDAQVQQNYMAEQWRLPPVANFTANQVSGTANLTVQFWDNSTNAPTEWQWNFGDGTANSTQQNPEHTYGWAGLYNVTLTVTNAGGSNTTVKTRYINVTAVRPFANFTASATSGTMPLMVQFNDTSSNNPTEWQWSFGDDTANSTLQNPEHTYTAAGVYNVTLTASNAGGSDSMVKAGYIIVTMPAPMANFTGTPTNGTEPLAVQFTDTSSNSPTAWQWSFGDDTANSTLQNPEHTYTAAGVYNLTLTASNAYGNGMLQRAGYVVVTSNASPGFVTDHLFSYYNWTGDSGSTIVDNSGNGHNGTNSGSVLINGPVAKRTFDGSATISLPQQPVAGWEGFAYETIILPTNVTPGTKHGIKGQSSGRNVLYLNGAKLVIRIVNTAGYAVETSSGNISAAVPTHVVMSYNNTTKYVRLYINGAYVTQVLLSSAGGQGQVWQTFPESGIANSYITGMGKFEGSMRYFRVYDMSLSDDQVLQNYLAESWRLPL